MWWEDDMEKSLRENQVFKTWFPVWNLSFKDLSSIKRFQYTLEHQNRNTKNTKIETQRNNRQIRRNTKEQQIRNTYMNPDLPNPGAMEVVPIKLQVKVFLLWVFGLMNLHRVLSWVPFFIMFFLQFLQIFIVWSSISSESQIFIVFFRFIFFMKLESLRLNLHVSNQSRGFEVQFLNWTRASKTWDVILQTSSQFLLNNDILWPLDSICLLLLVIDVQIDTFICFPINLGNA